MNDVQNDHQNVKSHRDLSADDVHMTYVVGTSSAYRPHPWQTTWLLTASVYVSV